MFDKITQRKNQSWQYLYQYKAIVIWIRRICIKNPHIKNRYINYPL